VSVGTYRTLKQAEIAERKAYDAIDAGTFEVEPPPPLKVTTVAEVVALWMETKRHTIEPNTAAGYQSSIDNHLVQALGHRDIATLTHDDVQRTVNAWRDAGKGAQLIHRCTMILRAALQREVRARLIPYNVADGIEKPSVKKRRDLTIWSPAQMAAFLAAANGDALFPFWHLTLLEGMRRSEALGLRWRDLRWNADASACTAVVVQTVVTDEHHGGRPLVQTRTKTRAGARSVMLTAATVTALKLHRDLQASRRRTLTDVWGDHDLIVTNELGDVVRPDSVKGHRIRIMAAAGVPALTTHDLRHVAATVMLQAGTPLILVSHKIGHSSTATTADIYGHIAPSDQAQANAAIDAYLARAEAETGTGATR
jgi:integrase